MTWQLLCIDDSPVDAELASWHLRRAGLPNEWRAVCTEDDLVDALQHQLPHVILSDVVMPQFDWRAALRVCRRLATVAPFIVVSDAISIQERQQAQQRGVFGCCEKDSTAELVKLVRSALKLP